MLPYVFNFAFTYNYSLISYIPMPCMDGYGRFFGYMINSQIRE